VQIRTLGGFEIGIDGEAVHFDRKTPRRTLDLVKCIVALGAAGAGRESIASALWPDAEGDAARSALEVTLFRLRRLLGHKSAAQLSHGVVRFDDSLVWIDAVEFEAQADRAIGEDGTVGVEAAARALDLYRGPFLPSDDDTPWLLPRRARLRSRFVRLAVHAAERSIQAGDPARAADIYAAALETEPLVETLYLRQMRCLAQQGRRAEAFDVYRVCRNMLAVAFGAAPSPETEAAHCSIRVG
jgi:DNA-binding SARP family transcriptional activator